jgi:hypothetical protein
MKCTECGTNNPPDARFCSHCAARLDKTCARCGEENPPGAKFCGGCGTGLSARATPAPDAAPQMEAAPTAAPEFKAAPSSEPSADEAGFLSHIPLAPPFEEPVPGAVPPTGLRPEAEPPLERSVPPIQPPVAAPTTARHGRERRRSSGLLAVAAVLIMAGIVTGTGFYLGRRGDPQKGKDTPTPAAVAPVTPAAPTVTVPAPAVERNPAPQPKPAVTARKPKSATPAVPLRRVRRPTAVSYHNRPVAKPKAPGKKPLTAAQKQALHRKQALQTARRSEAILKARAEKFRREHADVPPAASSGSDSQ